MFKDFGIDTKTNINKEILVQIKEHLFSLIPLSYVKLIEKCNTLIYYNEYILQKNNSHVSLNDFLQKKSINLNISPSDFSNIKKYINQLNIDFSDVMDGNIILQTDGKFLLDEKLTLLKVHRYYTSLKGMKKSKDEHLHDNEIEYYSSIKIYDFYSNVEEKEQLFAVKKLQNVLKNLDEHNKIRNMQILSTTDSSNIYDTWDYLIKNHSNKVHIKHIKKTDSQYIPSLFFVLIKFKSIKSNNYNQYIFYLENEVNFGVASHAVASTTKAFYELLEKRFDIQFQNPNNVDFKVGNQEEDFEGAIKEVILNLKNLINDESLDFLQHRQTLENKITTLKLQYPKMNLAYDYLVNLMNYIGSIKKISDATLKKVLLENTNFLIKQTLDENISLLIQDILEKISTKQMFLKNKVDIFQLRKSIYINKIFDSNKALCDIFEELNWDGVKNILNSLQNIEHNEEKLNKLFYYIDNEKYSLKDKQQVYKNIFLKQIHQGEALSLNLSNKLFQNF